MQDRDRGYILWIDRPDHGVGECDTTAKSVLAVDVAVGRIPVDGRPTAFLKESTQSGWVQKLGALAR
jgi:hypothetical protein